uniref:Phospholipase B-like n=1 Tax=Neobodo designis TaxID=312471 RepID=A0A7S1QDY0_NEODS|mmetsp:Transcript_42800/g.132183  ORF Transcript_42800/g.132183 Transcript_42800/m.132183 type:complete len:423 (+) Transcript_42800:46-1314(+)
MRLASCIALLALAATVAFGAPTAFPNCSGEPNPFPVNRQAPTFVAAVKNGKRYLAGQGNDTFHVLHAYGSHYEMGFAHGQLFGAEFDKIFTIFTQYLETMIENAVPWIPKSWVDLVAKYGLPAVLQLSVDWTKPFTPQQYIDEMQGMADGSGYSFDKIYQLNVFPELIKAACTIVGATKSATPNGGVAHLRDLDFRTNIPVKDWPLVTVLHGDGSQPKVANFGWVMLIGSLTGISEHPIGIGEKVWERHSQDDKVRGEPWMFILRDVLYTKSLEEALSTMQNANRTCAIHVGVGDGVENEFRGVTLAGDAYQVWNWSSINYPAHPMLRDVMYWDKHTQPDTHHFCLGDLLTHFYGGISAENLAVNVSSIGETGNMHSVSFDYSGTTAFFANARKTNVTTGNLNAYARQYTWLNVSALFAETL